MTFEERIKIDIAWRAVCDFKRQKGAPLPTTKEVDPSAYPPASAESWCIPIDRPRTYSTRPPDKEIADQDIRVDSLWIERERWIGRGLTFWVWKGYHASTNTIYCAVRLAPTVTVNWEEATTPTAPTRTP